MTIRPSRTQERLTAWFAGVVLACVSQMGDYAFAQPATDSANADSRSAGSPSAGSPSAGSTSLRWNQEMALAVRSASQRLLPAVVTVQPIGVADQQVGEVQLDASFGGLIVDADGHVLTSSFTVAGEGASLLAELSTGKKVTATLVARDFHRKLALLKLNVDGPVPYVDLTLEGQSFTEDGSSSASGPIQIGQTVIALSRTAGGAPMVARGILSATERLEGVALQTDARVSPGYYGGPLIDLYGRVLGISIPSTGQGGAENPTDWYDSGIAFAIDVREIGQKIDRLIEGEDIHKGLLGIVPKSRDPNEKSTEIAAVRPRSPAEQAGMLPGDEVIRVGSDAVDRFGAIKQALGRYDAGETLDIVIRRDKKELPLKVELAKTIPPIEPQRLGLALNDALEVQGVLPGSNNEKAIQFNDKLLRWNDFELSGIDDLRAKLMTLPPDSKVSLAVMRDGEEVIAEISPTTIADPALSEFPLSWVAPVPEWTVTKVDLPEAVGQCAAVVPKVLPKPEPSEKAETPADGDAKTEDDAPVLADDVASEDEEPEDPTNREDAGEANVADSVPYGLAVLLAKPGEEKPEELAKDWIEQAAKTGTIVLVVTSSQPDRWELKTLDDLRGFVASLKRQYPISESAIAIASLDFEDGKPGASDTLALAAAISQADVFSGVAVHSESRPPAIRLKENSAGEPLQIVLWALDPDDPPALSSVAKQAGYPVLSGENLNREAWLRWVRLLQTL